MRGLILQPRMGNVPPNPSQEPSYWSWAPHMLGRVYPAGAREMPVPGVAHRRSRLVGLGLVGIPVGEGELRKVPGVERECPVRKGEGYWWTRDRSGESYIKGSFPLTTHLCVAQHWVSSLNSRHSQWETFQSPQHAAEVVIATYGHCQGLLTCARGLRGRRQLGD